MDRFEAMRAAPRHIDSRRAIGIPPDLSAVRRALSLSAVRHRVLGGRLSLGQILELLFGSFPPSWQVSVGPVATVACVLSFEIVLSTLLL